MTKLKKRQQKKQQQELKDLRHEHESMEILRNCKALGDAIAIHLTRPHLTQQEILDLRECLQILARGRIG